MDNLHRLGLSVSYNRVRKLEDSLANAVCYRYRQEEPCLSSYLEKRTAHYWCIRQHRLQPLIFNSYRLVSWNWYQCIFSFPWWKNSGESQPSLSFANLTDPPDFSLPEKCFCYSCSGLQYLICGHSTSGYTRKKELSKN